MKKRKDYFILLLTPLFTLFTGCGLIEGDVKRYSSMFIFTLILGVILIIINVLKKKK